jgi:hypothetical protein
MDYCTNFICTYNEHDDDINNDIYRVQLLQAFCIDKYNDDLINDKINKLYSFLEMNHEKYLKRIINIIKNNNNVNNLILLFGDNTNRSDNTTELDNIMYFQILFLYDIFYLAHKFFCELINDGLVKKNTLKNLIININKY